MLNSDKSSEKLHSAIQRLGYKTSYSKGYGTTTFTHPSGHSFSARRGKLSSSQVEAAKHNLEKARAAKKGKGHHFNNRASGTHGE